jgi:hypothetical protein
MISKTLFSFQKLQRLIQYRFFFKETIGCLQNVYTQGKNEIRVRSYQNFYIRKNIGKFGFQ